MALSKPPRTQSLRQNDKNKSGGRRGHKGHTLNQVDNPNQVEKNELNHYPSCATDLTSQPVIKCAKSQLFDIPKPELWVTEY